MINLNECKFGDKLKLSTGEMGIYAGWGYAWVENPNNDILEYVQTEDKIHNIIIKHNTSFGIMQTGDYGRSDGGDYVVGRWEDDRSKKIRIDDMPPELVDICIRSIENEPITEKEIENLSKYWEAKVNQLK